MLESSRQMKILQPLVETDLNLLHRFAMSKVLNLRRVKSSVMKMFSQSSIPFKFFFELYEHDLAEVSSPICQCGEEEQTAFHIVTRCKLVNAELRSKAVNCIQSNKVVGENCAVLLNLSRNELFNKTLCDIIQTHSHILRTEVIL